MDEIAREHICLETETKITSPLLSKRPRTNCTMTKNHNGKSRFDFSELLAFQTTTEYPSPANTSQEKAGRVCKAECGDIEYDEPQEQPQDAELIIVTPINMSTTSNTDDAHTGSSEVCLVPVGRHFKLLLREEQSPFTETDNLSSYLEDYALGALAESHTSKDASADMSSHPDCKRLGKSLEDEPPGGCSLHAGNDKDGSQVQNSVSHIQAFTLRFSDEEVICQSDYTLEDAQREAGFYDKLSQSAEVEESNQKRDGFSENILFSKEKEEGYSRISSTDYAGSKSFYSNPEEQPSGNLAEGVKNEDKILELQICENENVAVCDGETKGQVNENGTSKNSIPSAAECAEGSIVSYDVVLARNIATESVRLEADDFCGAKGEHAACTMIARARSETADHTTETLMPARISQGPAGGDNDASPFSVIDPAIWSETDREAVEKRCYSESTAGAELFPLVKVCEMETPLLLYADKWLSREVSAPNKTGQFSHLSTTQQCRDEKEDLWQSCTEPQACPVIISEIHNKTGDQGSCHWKSRASSSPCRPAKPPPAGDGRQESHATVGHELKEQDHSSCFPVSSHHLKTQEPEYLQNEITRMNAEMEMKETEGVLRNKNSQHGKPETLLAFEKKQLQVNEKHIEDATKMLGIDRKIIKYGTYITHIAEGMGNNLECLSDHPYSAVMSTMGGKTDEEGRTEEAMEETHVHGNSETLAESEDDQKQQSQQSGDTQCVCECTEGCMSNKLTPVSPHEQEDKLTCFSDDQHRAETFLFENKDDLSVCTFPPTSDAVVPGPHELVHSPNSDNNPTPLDCNDRFSPVPSAVISSDRVPGGFDTFERIQLSPDDDAGQSSSPLLISLPRQLKTPQQQLSQSAPEAESSEHEEVPEEEEVGRFESHTEHMAEGFSGSDTSCNELPNFISPVDGVTPGWPEKQVNCESSNNSSEVLEDDITPQSLSSTVPPKSDRPALDASDSPKFEMKRQFDMVLKELNLFFQISIGDFASETKVSSPEQCGDSTEALEGHTSKCKDHLNSPELGHRRDTSSDDADEDCSLEMGGAHPGLFCTSGSGNGEQEVPLGRHMHQDTTMYTSEKHTEPREMEHKRKMWSPSFVCQPFLEQLSHRQPEQTRRLEPLRTCTRPIRVGLSKRAKTKHLHRPHPYK